MLLFDLSHDRMSRDPLVRVADVQQAVVTRKVPFTQAAQRIGLTHQEFDEMQQRISRGEVKRTTLPVHLDAMAGEHRGRVYAIRDVRVLPKQSAYVVALRDGKRVYIPVVCGNLSVVRGKPAAVRIAHHPRASSGNKHRALARARVSAAGAAAAPESGLVATAPLPPAGNSPQTSSETAAAPPVASTVQRSPSHRGFHVPGAAWAAAALGAIGAFWSGGGGSSVASDACP